MIVKEFYKARKDGVNLYRTYSDQRLMIRKVGTSEEYGDAIDIEDAPWEYEETDKPISTKEHMAGSEVVT